MQLFAGATAELGFPEEADKNDELPEGFGPVPMNVHDGRRVDVGAAFLRSALARPSLNMTTAAVATRIVTSSGRVRGVEYLSAGRLEVEWADRVVLTSGAIGSAQILLRSGIGLAEHLRDLGVPIVAEEPGVGTGFSDHPQIAVHWESPDEDAMPSTGFGGALHS